MIHTILLTGTLITGIAGPTLERRTRARLWCAVFQTAWWAAFAIWTLLDRVMDFAVAESISAALWGHLAWELWRRNRKPPVSRALGRVVNLGHRLAVRPEPVQVTR